MRVFVALLALCLYQASGNPIALPAPGLDLGDLSLPGFVALNNALNEGLVDLAPGLARIAPRPNGDLAGTLAKFFDEMAFSCYFYEKKELAKNFEVLRDMAPEMAELAEINNVVPQTWDLLLALRTEGISIINLRIHIADAIVEVEGEISDLISIIRTQVNDLKSKNQDLIAYKAAFKELVEKFHKEISIQIADVAKIVQILANQLGDVGNNRDEVSTDMISLFRAIAQQKEDLFNAVTYMTNEWARIEKGLKRIVGKEETAPISANVALLSQLVHNQMVDVGSVMLYTINAARESYEAMLELFPHSERSQVEV